MAATLQCLEEIVLVSPIARLVAIDADDGSLPRLGRGGDRGDAGIRLVGIEAEQVPQRDPRRPRLPVEFFQRQWKEWPRSERPVDLALGTHEQFVVGTG